MSTENQPDTPESERDERTKAYIMDMLAYGQRNVDRGLGRPALDGPVRRNDMEAVEYWIGKLPQFMKGHRLVGLYTYFTYLSDLAPDARAGSIDGLLNPAEDIKELRKGLLEELQRFPAPSQMNQAAEGISQETYADAFESLFARTIGIREYQEFVDAHGDNHEISPSSNPYLRMDPDVKHGHMQDVIAQTLLGLNSPQPET